MSVTCVGIIIDARYTLNSFSENGNFIFVNAKAAIDAEITVISVYVNVIKRLFPAAFRNGNIVNTCEYAFVVGSFGIHWIGIAIRAPLLFRDVEIIQKNGIMTMTAIKVVKK